MEAHDASSNHSKWMMEGSLGEDLKCRHVGPSRLRFQCSAMVDYFSCDMAPYTKLPIAPMDAGCLIPALAMKL